jgi:methionyl-tRNA formyltransferase
MVSPPPALRIAFFGTPEFAVPTLQALHESRHPVVGIITQPDRPRGRGHQSRPGPIKELGLHLGIPVLQPDRLRDDGFLESFRALEADLGVVAAYGRILTDAVLDIPTMGLINVHASLLPRHRGAAPVHRAIMAGDCETGVSIMRVVKALDAGPTFATARRPIDPDETSVDVEADLARIGAVALVEVVDAIADGRAVETPQDDSRATYAHKVERADGIVDWGRSAADIHNQIRGLHPWPHAFSDLEGERTILLRSKVEAEHAVPPGTPGTIIVAHADELTVQTGDGVLRVVTIQREGGRPVSAREFIAGRRIQPGARFSRTELRP